MLGSMLELDANGWAVGIVDPMPVEHAWSLVSPEPSSRVDAGRWAHQARTFFGAIVELQDPKSYPSATLPLADAGVLEIRRIATIDTEPPSRVFFSTLPLDRAPAVRAAAMRGAEAIGGAGFDVLVQRGQRLWQVQDAAPGGDPRAPLAVAALIASVFLAPILPPGGGTLFGVKGARERLERLGWR